MNANTAKFPAPRVAPDQWRAFGGVWRLTSARFLSRTHLLSVAGMTALLAGLSATATSGDAGGYIEWVADFYLLVVVPILAFLSGAGTMRDETRAGTADYVFTRPVRRWAYVGFKYLAHTACTLAGWLPAFAVLVVSASQRQVPALGETFAMVLLAQTLTIAAFGALGFLCAVLTGRYLVLGLVYAAIVEVGIGNIPAPLSGLSMTRQVRGLIEPALLGAGSGVSAPAMVAATGAVALFAAVCVAAAAGLFSTRELMGARAKE